jgi:hypothetical protein
VLEFTLVVWLAKGGFVERPADARDCAHITGLYRSALASGQTLMQRDKEGRQQIVLDVRCKRRAEMPVS